MSDMRLAERFWPKVDQSGGLWACWPWTASLDGDNRGQIKVGGRPIKAPRIALSLTLGRPLRDGYQALHHCDNPPCVNPAHLYEGTPTDNVRDRVVRGHRDGGRRGGGGGRAKLTISDVHEIRRRSLAGEGYKRLALAFAVHRTAIQDVVRRETYAYVEETP